MVGTDPKSDLAVVKVDNVDVQRGARWATPTSCRSASGSSPSAIRSASITPSPSACSRPRTARASTAATYEDFLQTDASINPGNSGGPLVNLDGEVIGINTMIAGIGTGIGFAVPSSMAKPIADQLIETGRVRRPFLGVVMQEMTPELAKRIGTNAPEQGALVGQVQPGSPADEGRHQAGDVIVAIDGSPVDRIGKAVQRTVLGKQIGQKVT